MRRKALRLAVLAAAAAVAGCAGVLSFDYFRARSRAAADAARIERLQREVREDAGRAAALHSEQERLTKERDQRNRRKSVLTWVLIVAGAALVSAAKPLAEEGKPAARRKPEPGPVAGESGPRASVAAGPPPVDLAFVEEVVAREGVGAEAAIAILQAIQEHYRYLPDEALRRVCELTEITPAQIAGTSTFYSRFRRGPVGKHIVRVCHGTACHVKGARQVTEQLRRDLGIAEGMDTDRARMYTIEEVACLGCCSLAPVLMVDERTAGGLTPATARGAVEAALAERQG